MKNRKFLPFMSMLLAATVIAWSCGAVSAATNTADIQTLSPSGTKKASLVKPPDTPAVPAAKKPILTKSWKKAALMEAAEAIFQQSISILAPISATDHTKVPHYFGPFPNWANSPFTLPDVPVDLTRNRCGLVFAGSFRASLLSIDRAANVVIYNNRITRRCVSGRHELPSSCIC